MFATIVKSAILGGLAVFFWGSFSWMVLPWHQSAVNGIPNEAAFSKQLKSSIQAPGIYVVPHDQSGNVEAIAAKITEGPFVFMAVRPHGVEFSMGRSMFTNLLVNILTAGLLCWLLLLAKVVEFKKRVLFVTIGALSGTIYTLLSQWNWWHFPNDFTTLTIVDALVAWLLAGIVIAKVTPTTLDGSPENTVEVNREKA